VANLARTGHPWGRRPLDAILSAGSVQVGSESIYYAASGIAESGAAILFLHESGGTGATWSGQLSGLAQQARCLVPDLPGHGQSEGGGLQTIAEYRRAMLGFLDALAIRWPVLVAGVCLGAAIAVDLALHAPDRVAGLVLAGLHEGGRACATIRHRTSLGEAPAEFVERMFSGAASPRLKSEQAKRWRMASPTVRHADLLALAGYPLRDALQGVRHRTMLVGGQHDAIASPEYTARLALEAPRGERVTIGEAGCLSMVERPDQFNRVVAAFLQEVQPGQLPTAAAVHRGGYRRYS